MRIGCCGVGGTGKSTAVNGLIDRCRDLPILLPSVARRVWEELGWAEKDNPNKSPIERRIAQQMIFDARLKKEEEMESFISDRTLLDTYCYMLLWSHEAMSDALAQQLWLVVKSNMQKYHRIFYFPLRGFRVEEHDQVRMNGYPQALILDALLESCLVTMDLKYNKMWETKQEKRVAIMEENVRSICPM